MTMGDITMGDMLCYAHPVPCGGDHGLVEPHQLLDNGHAAFRRCDVRTRHAILNIN